MLIIHEIPKAEFQNTKNTYRQKNHSFSPSAALRYYTYQETAIQSNSSTINPFLSISLVFDKENNRGAHHTHRSHLEQSIS